MQRTTVCVLVMAIMCIGVRGADDKKSTSAWSLIVENGESRKAIRLDDGNVSDLKIGVGRFASAEPLPGEQRTIFNAVSPDGRHIIYELTSGTDPRKHVIALAQLDGKMFRTLVDNGLNTRPAWSPNSKQIAFVSERNGVRHVYRIDVDGANEKHISREPVLHGCRPGFAADGRIVYAVDRGRDGKMSLADLVIGDGENETVLVRRQFIIDSMTTADGSRLAVIVPGELAVHDLKTGAVQRFTMKEANPTWHATFYSLLWRPDGRALATGFGFLGGRQAGTHVEGEDHVGILMLDSPRPAVNTYKVGDGYGLYAWVTDEQIQRRK